MGIDLTLVAFFLTKLALRSDLRYFRVLLSLKWRSIDLDSFLTRVDSLTETKFKRKLEV